SSNNTKIFLNYFINNEFNAVDSGINNTWDDELIGNSWDDYGGVDANDDGIGDTPYTIIGGAGSQDNYPIFWDAPIISIDSPVVNTTFQNTAPQYNISIEGVPISIWYTIEGIVGTFPITELTGTVDQDTWDSLDDGDITITFYAQDSENEIGSTNIIVIKIIPSTPPSGGIPGYNLFFLLGIISVVAIVLSTKLKKFNK
ncbi:MAG: Loki-CTERM sorting domain-containing protein, partial [Promethearchaeota archaeon]